MGAKVVKQKIVVTRLTGAQRAQFEARAAEEGRTLSGWVRCVLNRAATQEEVGVARRQAPEGPVALWEVE